MFIVLAITIPVVVFAICIGVVTYRNIIVFRFRMALLTAIVALIKEDIR
ncbi:MAG: hypothetical protein HY506_00725, partial [Candidatus Yanofskybacteria bacterium]|nr:hypothetical protein [Candidatus Yanofskybacteria bacterium]